MRKIFVLGIFMLLFTNLLYGISDSLNVADSSLSIQPKIKIRSIRDEKGAVGWSSGLVFGKGWTVRVKIDKFAVQGSFAVIPDIMIIGGSRGNNYYFGIACSYDIAYLPYSRFYIISGTRYSLNYMDEKKWYVGIAPAFDFCLPFSSSISFNCGLGFSYPLQHPADEERNKIVIKTELGFYFRVF